MPPDWFLLYTHQMENYIVCPTSGLLLLDFDYFCDQFPNVGALVSGGQSSYYIIYFVLSHKYVQCLSGLMMNESRCVLNVIIHVYEEID